MRRLLLVEDDPHVASFVRQGLSEEGYVVEWAATGREGQRRALAEAFDALVLDVRLPDGSGVEVCREVRRHDAAVPVLMLTALDAVEDRVAGLRAGADDYLPKPFAFDELLARLDALLRRAAVEPPDRSHADGALVLDPATRDVWHDGTRLDLTATEFDLLAYFLARRGQALSRDEIHRAVWGHDFDRGTNLIDVYVGYLRRKLAEAGCPAVLEAVRSVGYRYVSADA
jgi:two-component system OmpR family response regulator/two-component system response regulator MprA